MTSLEKVAESLLEVDTTLEADGWVCDLESAKKGYEKAFGKYKDGVDHEKFNYKIVAGFDPRLRADKRFMLAMIKCAQFVQDKMISNGWGLALKYASPELKSDKEFVIEAIKNGEESGWDIANPEPVYRYIDPSLQSDTEIILLSAELHSKTWDFIPKDKFADAEFVESAIKKGLVRILKYAPDSYRKDLAIVKKMLEALWKKVDYRTDWALESFEKQTGLDLSIIGDHIYEKYSTIQYCTKEQNDNEDFVRKALQKDYNNVHYISERLASNKQFLLDTLCGGGIGYEDLKSVMADIGHSITYDEVKATTSKIAEERARVRNEEAERKAFDPKI